MQAECRQTIGCYSTFVVIPLPWMIEASAQYFQEGDAATRKRMTGEIHAARPKTLFRPAIGIASRSEP